MKNIFSVIKNLVKQGDYSLFWKIIKYRFHSKTVAFGFRQDLESDQIKRRALIPITIRKHVKGDEVFFTNNNSTVLIKKLNTCYVAINKENTPCFKCWLIDSSQNNKLKEFWDGTFPSLKTGEVLLESAFTVPKYRGFGIMPAAISLILELAKEQGFNEVITYVPEKNINSIRTIAYVGFHPFITRIEKWFLFRKMVTFVPITDNLMDYYNKITNEIPKTPLKPHN